MKHTTAPIEPSPIKDRGVRDSVETAIDLAKGLDLESWERRMREDPAHIPKWGGEVPYSPIEAAGHACTKAARVLSRSIR